MARVGRGATTSMDEHCSVLGVQRGCTDIAALKAAFKAASLKAHPDQGGSDAEFQRVSDAYAALSKHCHDERWGTSSSAYGAGAASAV
eukprot:CAMPEP_0176297402 /NCGR_PEP_ID=MMETSP0121_2-20121125/58703_1 /TAXON_ID=160619 /ORGANISM="Kryptoperidinium foliaceum, Strain CCMP 1326" /LENGTH=87 /DNA_ID=CAMNT_0017638589 /DNA_START=18 /DNA_END=277 /DNA_ORIENTATION=-